MTGGTPSWPPVLTRIRFLLFVATSLVLPFHVFRLALFLGRSVDLATIVAGLFVLSSMPALVKWHATRVQKLFVLGTFLAPALVLVPPIPERFSVERFAVSYAHWLLMVMFFLGALTLRISRNAGRWLARACLAAGLGVALFGLYQAVGIPRGWPGTSAVLTSFQTEPFRFATIGSGGYVRPTSVFLEPAWMGGYLVSVVALAIPLALEGRTACQRMAVICAITLLNLAIFASVSWGAYLDAGAAALAGVAARGTIRHRRGFFVVTAVGFCLLAIFLGSPLSQSLRTAMVDRWRLLRETAVSEKGSTHVHGSEWLRKRNAEQTIALFRRHPVGGVGLGQFGRYRDASQESSLRDTQADVWAGWLAVGAEVGVFGPFLLGGALWIVFARWRNAAVGARWPSVVAMLAVAVAQQLHTGSYIDLWWWYPVSVAGALSHLSDSGAPVISTADIEPSPELV